MNRILLLLPFFLFSFLSYAQEPGWIKNLSKGCQKRKELCAMGIGESKGQARRNARVELAKIFENKLSSKFTSKLTSRGQETLEDLSEEIEETTDVILEGVTIKETYEDQLNYYALAFINKSKVVKGLRREILKMDEVMLVLKGDSKASSVMKLERHFLKRESLLKRYEFLQGGTIPSPVLFSDIFTKKRETLGAIIIHVYLDEKGPKLLEGAIGKLLSDSGYKITRGRKRNKHSTHVLTGELTSEKQYMKVKGFEKYKMSIKLATWSKGKVETGHLQYSTVQSGRDFSQAYEKSVIDIEKYIREHLEKLNID